MLLLLLAACHRTADAPTELNELGGWLFTHASDEETEELGLGLDNLKVWLDAHEEETLEGYKVNNLDQETLDSLDDKDRPADALAGAAITTEGRVEITEVSNVVVAEDQVEVFPETYTKCDRTFEGDPECFADSECDDIDFTADSILGLPLGIELTASHEAHYRWIDTTDSGRVMMSRTWLQDEPVSSADWLKLHAQYGMTVTYSEGNGSSVLRLQAMWAQVEVVGADIDGDGMVNQLIDSLRTTDETMYTWIDEH